MSVSVGAFLVQLLHVVQLSHLIAESLNRKAFLSVLPVATIHVVNFYSSRRYLKTKKGIIPPHLRGILTALF